MISLEGRIARIEITLAAILDKLPKFIREPLGKAIEENIEAMRKDAIETIRVGRDTQ